MRRPGQERPAVVVHAVGDVTDDRRVRERLVVRALQLLDRRVGIGPGLKVGEEALGPVAAAQNLHPMLDLGTDAPPGQPAVRAEAAVVAVDAAADRDLAIDIRTGEPRVNGNAVHPPPEALP